MTIFFKSTGFQEGYTHITGPDNSPLAFISFGKLQLKDTSAPYFANTAGNEVVLDILGGRADVTVNFQGKTIEYKNIGGRENMFGGRPTLVCLPPKTDYTVKALTEALDIAVSAGPSPEGAKPVVIGPDDSGTNIAGKANFQRQVHQGTVGTGKTLRLMVGETISGDGSWSSYPPHKHDEVRPGEVPQEEVYLFKLNPESGFAIQVLYDAPNRPDGRDAAFLLRDGDTVVLDHGYHPVTVAPGYQVGYLWVLYADGDVYGSWTDDPLHAWVKEA